MQEQLDVRAVAAGLKPAAFLGFDAPADRALAQAQAAGLSVAWRTAWISAGELQGVPDWYAEVVAAEKAATRILVAAREDEPPPPPFMVIPAKAGIHSSDCGGGGVDPGFRRDDERGWDVESEAAMLGYPPCCVADHAAWRAALHRHCAALTLAAAGGDVARARRLAAAGWTPVAPAIERRVAPYTSIIMCPACAADPDSPARALSRAYAGLA